MNCEEVEKQHYAKRSSSHSPDTREAKRKKENASECVPAYADQVSTSSSISQPADSQISIPSNGNSTVNITGSTMEHSALYFRCTVNSIVHQQEEDSSIKMTKDELYDKLKNALKSSAKSSTRITAPVGGKIMKFVPLQITTDSQRPTGFKENGGLNKRKDILKFFKHPEGNVDLKELFDKAEERGRIDEGRYCCDNKFCYNAIGMIGQPGIGKTTLCKHLINEALQKPLWKFELVFYIPFRDINDEKTYDNLLQFLMASSSSEWNSCKEEDEKVLKLLIEDDKVLLILDGLDEAVFEHVGTRAVPIFCYQSAKARSYVKNILCGNLLSQATKFVTSRPLRMFEMNSECRPHFISNILGLNEETKKELCQQISGKNFAKVMKYLAEHPDISANCYVPVTCIIVVNAIQMSLMNNSDNIDCGTITSIMLYTLKHLVKSSHVRSDSEVEQELRKLVHFAMDAFSKNVFVFHEKDFVKFKIDRQMLQNFLQAHTDSTFECKILDGEKCSYFSHLTWQEFFTAIHMIVFMDFKPFSKLQSKFSTSRYEVCVKFMMGLCNTKNVTVLKSLFNNHKATDVEKKRSFFKEFVLKIMNKIFVLGKKSNITFLQVCNWVYEAQHEELRAAVANNLPSELELKGNLLPSDVGSLHYILRGCKKPCQLEVGFGKKDYVADSFEHFLKELATTLENPHVSLPSLNLDNNKSITDGGMNHISKCLNHIEDLSMRDCNISAHQVEILSKGLAKMSTPMKSLDLGNNKFGNDGLKKLISLDKVEKLNIRNCDLSAPGITSLSTALCELSQPMKRLDLSSNKIGCEGLKNLTSSLNKVEELYIGNCRIATNGIAIIAKGLSKLPQALKTLDLSNNKFRNKAVPILTSSLNKIEELYIGNCNITADGILSITEALSKQEQPIKILHLGGNQFGDDGAKKLASCLSKVEELYIGNCNITADGSLSITEALSKQEQPIKILHLGGNQFGDDGAKKLASCLSKVEKLDLRNCNITADGIASISEALSKLLQSMKSLDLGNNKFGNDGMQKLISSLDKVEELNIRNCDLSAPGITSLSTALCELSQSVKSLDLSENKFGDNGAKHLPSFFSKVEKLHIEKCGISSSMITKLTNTLRKSSLPKPKVCIGKNKYLH